MQKHIKRVSSLRNVNFPYADKAVFFFRESSISVQHLTLWHEYGKLAAHKLWGLFLDKGKSKDVEKFCSALWKGIIGSILPLINTVKRKMDSWLTMKVSWLDKIPAVKMSACQNVSPKYDLRFMYDSSQFAASAIKMLNSSSNVNNYNLSDIHKATHHSWLAFIIQKKILWLWCP